MKSTVKSIILICAFSFPASLVGAQATQPADTGPSQYEINAIETFMNHRYAAALPMLRKVEEELTKSHSDRVDQIREDIRVAEQGIADAKAMMGASTPAAAAPAAPDFSNRTPHPAPEAGKVLDTTIRELGNFSYDSDKGGNIPDDVKALSGNKIRLRGFMIPIDQASSITQFALVTDLMSCCFGQPPQIQHTVVATCPKGKSVAYYPDEITVEGTLKVEEKKDDGFIVSIFEVDVSSVKPSAK